MNIFILILFILYSYIDVLISIFLYIPIQSCCGFFYYQTGLFSAGPALWKLHLSWRLAGVSSRRRPPMVHWTMVPWGSGSVWAGWSLSYLWVPMVGLMENLPTNIWFRVPSWLRKAPFCLGNLDLERDHLGTAGIGQRIYGCEGSDGCIHQETTFASDGKKISLVMPITMQHPLSAASTELWMSLVRWWFADGEVFFVTPGRGTKDAMDTPIGSIGSMGSESAGTWS